MAVKRDAAGFPEPLLTAPGEGPVYLPPDADPKQGEAQPGKGSGGNGASNTAPLGGFKRLVTPQQAWEKSEVHQLIAFMPAPIAGAKNDQTKTPFAVDSRGTVAVWELVYPGNKVEPVDKKWIYAFDAEGKNIVAEAYAETTGQWLIWTKEAGARSKDPNKPPKTKAGGSFRLPAGKYQFFISPYRLSDGAVKILSDAKEPPMVKEESKTNRVTLVACPDAFRWAEDARNQYVEPRRQAHHEWISDPNNQAGFYLASTFKALIEKKYKTIGFIPRSDPFGIDNELRSGQPDKFLKQYEEERQKRFCWFENAGVYLAQWVDSPWHKATERAALDSDPFEVWYIASCFQHWAIVLDGACEYMAGNVLVDQLIADKERFPYKYILDLQANVGSPPAAADDGSSEREAPEPEEHGMVNFAFTKKTWGTASKIFLSLLPKLISQSIKDDVGAKIIKQLEQLKIDGEIGPTDGKLLQLLKQESKERGSLPIARGTPLSSAVEQKLVNKGASRRQRFRYADLQSAAKKDPASTKTAAFFKKLDSLPLMSEDHKIARAKIKLSVTGLLEVINMGILLSDLIKDPKHKVKLDHIKSAASLTALILDFYQAKAEIIYKAEWKKANFTENVMRKVGNTEKLKVINQAERETAEAAAAKAARSSALLSGGSAFFGVVTGVIDFSKSSDAWSGSAGQGDYGAATANAVATTAAAGSAIISGVALGAAAAAALSAGAGGAAAGSVVPGAGTVIGGAVCGIVAFGAAIAAHALAQNPYEQIAYYSFLGKADIAKVTHDRVAWANAYFGRRMHTPVEQAQLLNHLFSHFSLESVGKGDPWPEANNRKRSGLIFYPGYFERGALLDVVIHQRYDREWYVTRMEIDLLDGVATASAVQSEHGLIMDLDYVQATFKDEVLEKIEITVTPWVVSLPGDLVYFEDPDSRKHWHKAFSWKETWASVRLRVSNGASTRTTPIGGRWLRFNMTDDDSAAALDSSKWVDDSKVMSPPES